MSAASTSRRGDLLITPHRAPEALFGLGPIEVDGDTTRGSMTTRPWMSDVGGRPCAGMLGVLLDDVVGQATLTARPDGHWPVTTELSIDVLADLPADGSVLEVVGELLTATERSSTARGEVRDRTGTLVALATVATHYVPGVPDVGGPADARDHGAAAHLHGAFAGVLDADPPRGADLVVPPGPTLENATGRGHGGVVAALADAVAAAAVADARRPVRTTGLRVAYLRPVQLHGPLRLTARVVHRGRATALTRVDVVDADGRVCVAATVTHRAPDE